MLARSMVKTYTKQHRFHFHYYAKRMDMVINTFQFEKGWKLCKYILNCPQPNYSQHYQKSIKIIEILYIVFTFHSHTQTIHTHTHVNDLVQYVNITTGFYSKHRFPENCNIHKPMSPVNLKYLSIVPNIK